MTNVTLDIRANGTIAVIDGFSKAKTTKGILKDLAKEMAKRGYNELANGIEDKDSLEDMATYAQSNKPLESEDNHYTFDFEVVEEEKTYISHSFVL